MKTLISPEIFDSKVIAFFTGKKPGDDLERISEIASIKRENIYMPIQRHTNKILILDSDLDPKIADAIITNREGILIGVQVSDCVPILLYDRVSHVVGAVHAGWRGTASEILKKTIKAMTNRFFSSPSNIVVAIGPSIRWCCYGVGYEVIEAVKKATDSVRRSESIVQSSENSFIKKGEKYCLDLSTANKYQAVSMGVLSENIWMSEECTFCLPEKYYSYRFAKGPTGRQGGFIGMVNL